MAYGLFDLNRPNSNLSYSDLYSGISGFNSPSIPFTQSANQMNFAAPSVPKISSPISPSINSFGVSGSDDLSNALTNSISGNFTNPVAAATGIGTGDPTKMGLFESIWKNKDGGFNMQNITSLLGSIGSIYGAMKTYGLAKDQFNFSKDFALKNLDNQTKSYNTALEDRARARASQEGSGQSYIDEYVKKNRL